MVTVDELAPGTLLSDPMRITVTNVDWSFPGRRAVVDADDSAGQPIRLIDFEGADIEIEWQEGRHYHINQCDVKQGSDGFDLQLEPSGKTIIEPDQATAQTKLFVFADTHVGYRHRSRSDKNKWSRNVDCRDVFSRCIDRALDQRVDAVIHAGDIFDHNNRSGDRKSVKQGINKLANSGIPFYYVFGNHDDVAGKTALENSRGIHLASGPQHVEGHSLNLLGVDHAGSKFPTSPPPRTNRLSRDTNVLVTHEKLYPVVDEDGDTVYNRRGNIAEISEYFLEVSYGIDYLVSGHQHLSKRGKVRGFGTDVMITGSPAQLRKPREDEPFSTWILKMTEGDFELNRHSL